MKNKTIIPPVYGGPGRGAISESSARGRMGQGASAGAGGLCSFRLPDHHGHGQLLPLPGRTDLSALLELFASGLSGGEGQALTPDGNLSLIDDLGGTSSGKQFITVETKGGNVFYLIIDRDDEGAQTVHFLNQVDEADLLALMEDGEAQEAPAVCTCTEKCQAGAVNTSCEVCAVNMAECAGAEPEPEPEPEPEAEKSGGMGALALVLALVVLGGGGAFAYIKFIRPKQASKVSADPDDYDFADEEEYINEDEPEPEEEMEDTK